MPCSVHGKETESSPTCNVVPRSSKSLCEQNEAFTRSIRKYNRKFICLVSEVLTFQALHGIFYAKLRNKNCIESIPDFTKNPYIK